MKFIKIFNVFRKIVFAIFFILIVGTLSVYGYLEYLTIKIRKLDDIFLGEYGCTYRESTLEYFRWQHLGKHAIDDVKNKRYDLEWALLQLELGGISIEQMDSIAGDSSWRIRDAEILRKDGTISKVKVW